MKKLLAIILMTFSVSAFAYCTTQVIFAGVKLLFAQLVVQETFAQQPAHSCYNVNNKEITK